MVSPPGGLTSELVTRDQPRQKPSSQPRVGDGRAADAARVHATAGGERTSLQSGQDYTEEGARACCRAFARAASSCLARSRSCPPRRTGLRPRRGYLERFAMSGWPV